MTPAYLPALPSSPSRALDRRRSFTPSPTPPPGLDDPPTMRVAVFGPPASASSPAATPPPQSDRRLTCLAPSGAVVEDIDDDGPRAGETYQGFELVEELGQGAFARVFLARQQVLAGRLVALKVTRRPTKEAERLARLQHTNIVPVYSVHDAPAAQVICMPFLGRGTIAGLVRAYRAEHPSRVHPSRRTNGTRGTRQVRTTAVGSRSGGKPEAPAPGPRAVPAPAGSPAFVGDPAGVLRVVAQLAAGLAHAHARGILHLDLKPANVLLADTGEPMLLDFNLSFDTTVPGRDLVGGTVPYMAPEQLLDIKSRGKGGVDARTDLYSLGVMTFEMLTGEVPFPASFLSDTDGLLAARRRGPPSVRRLNPAVTPAVEAVVGKLLAPDPRDRYQTAEELRADIERHLDDLPLKFAREASVRERLGKWRRRNPAVPGRLAAAALIGLVFGLGAVAYLRDETATRATADAHVRFTRTALDPVRLDLVIPNDPAARARGVVRAEEVLATYGLPADARWARRADVRCLPEGERVQLGGDLGELLLLLARAKWEQAAAGPADERPAAAAAALKLVRAARTCFPAGETPAVLDELAADLTPAAGEPAEPAARAADRPETTRDTFLRAAFAVARGSDRSAAPLLEKVIADRPGHAAAQFALAYCRQQAGQFDRALERYDAARVVLPDDPRPFYQRGLIYTATRRPAEAEAEFDKVIALDPDGVEAYQRRGRARFRLGRVRDAEADFTAALDRGASPLQARLLRAEARKALGDAAGEAADRRAAAEAEPRTEADFLVRGTLRVAADPWEAVADFEKALRLNPRSLAAVQNQAYVLADKLGDAGPALEAMDRAVQMYPEFAPARIGRAVLLARLGHRDEAHREAERARLLADDPEVTYQAGCVFALTSKTRPEDKARAMELIRKALRDGFTDLRTLDADHDLDPVRTGTDFRALRNAAGELLRP